MFLKCIILLLSLLVNKIVSIHTGDYVLVCTKVPKYVLNEVNGKVQILNKNVTPVNKDLTPVTNNVIQALPVWYIKLIDPHRDIYMIINKNTRNALGLKPDACVNNGDCVVTVQKDKYAKEQWWKIICPGTTNTNCRIVSATAIKPFRALDIFEERFEDNGRVIAHHEVKPYGNIDNQSFNLVVQD